MTPRDPSDHPGPSDSKSLTPGQCKALWEAKVNDQWPCGEEAMDTNSVTPGSLGRDKCVHLPNFVSASWGQESKHRDPELGLCGRVRMDYGLMHWLSVPLLLESLVGSTRGGYEHCDMSQAVVAQTFLLLPQLSPWPVKAQSPWLSKEPSMSRFF